MSHFENYYMRQAHGNGMPVFSGASLQKGHGIGNILSSAFRTMIPVLKVAGKVVGKNVAKQGLHTGVGILSDVLRGQNLKQATKRRLREGGSQLIKKAKASLFSQTPPPSLSHPSTQKRIKRRKTSKRNQSRARTSIKKHRDIFS